MKKRYYPWFSWLILFMAPIGVVPTAINGVQPGMDAAARKAVHTAYILIPMLIFLLIMTIMESVIFCEDKFVIRSMYLYGAGGAKVIFCHSEIERLHLDEKKIYITLKNGKEFVFHPAMYPQKWEIKERFAKLSETLLKENNRNDDLPIN